MIALWGVIPYVAKTRKELYLANVFAGSNILGMLRVFIPAGCTGELQPLDVGVNQEFKELMKNSFCMQKYEVLWF